jgi:GNAT superfamily N-acetyltransferase
MDKNDLAQRMRRLTQWVDSQRQPSSLIRREFRGTPLGHCYLTMDAGRQTAFASTNINRVYLCGAEEGMSSGGVGRLIDMFVTEGVKRFFVWLSPGPDMEQARNWLQAHGLSRVTRTGYPTLCRTARSPVRFETDLEIREVDADEIAKASAELGETLWPEYSRSAGREEFFHYMAFDGGRPVAIAALCIFEDLGYLMAAATAERDRKRGAQQALIARRIQRAEQMGCSIQVSETMYMIEHSYRNLQRAGFEEAYEKEIYQWTDGR